MSYGIKIGRKENIVVPDLSVINDPKQSIDYGLSYFVGPKDWSEDKEQDVETTFYNPSSKQFCLQLKKLSDFTKKR